MINATAVEPIIQAAGWSLVHLVWQATLIALLLAALLRLLEGSRSSIRYATAVGALAAVTLFFAGTFARELSAPPAIAPEIAESSAGVSLDPASIAAMLGAEGAERALTKFDDTRDSLREWASALSMEEVAAQVDRRLPAVVSLWLLGVALFSLRLTMGLARIRTLIRTASPASAALTQASQRLSHALGLRRAVRIAASVRVQVPTVVGWLRPVVLVPLSAMTGLTAAQLETILAHELAHIRRHDYAVNLLQSVVETLFFYHPAVWWISNRIRAEREHCCDDMAVAVCADPVLYAKALTRLEQVRGAAVPALGANGGSLLARIRRLVGAERPDHLSRAWGVGTAILGLATAAAIAAPSMMDGLFLTERPLITFGLLQGGGGGYEEAVIHEDGEVPPAPPAPAAPQAPRVPRTPGVAPVPAVAPAPVVPAVPPVPAVEPVIAPRPPRPALAYAYVTQKDGSTVSVVARRADEDHDDEHSHSRSIDSLIRLRAAGVNPEYVRDMEALGLDPSLDELASLAAVGVTPAYVKEMQASGFDDLDVEDLVSLRAVGVTPDFVRWIREAGYTDFDSDEVVSLRAVGVSPEYMRSLKAAGVPPMSLDDLVTLRAVGVNPDYIAAMRAKGFSDLDADEIAGLRSVGVTPEYIDDLRRAGLRDFDADDVMGLRAVGVNGAYIAELRRAGVTNFDADDLIGLRGVGVDGQYLAKLKAVGFTSIDAEDLMAARGTGVDPKFLEDMRAAGFEDLDLEEAAALRAVGVNADYIAGMRKLGLDFDADDLAALKGVGVTVEYVRSLQEAGLTELDVHDLVRLKATGVDADFIQKMRRR